MKRIFLFSVFILAALFSASVGAAVTHSGIVICQPVDTGTTDCTVVDSQYTGNWDCLDSFVVVYDTVGRYVFTVTGVAKLGAYDKLYIALGNDSANRVDSATSATTGQTHPNLDTMIFGGFINLPYDIYLPFTYIYTCSISTAATDTIYINAATGTANKPITLYDVLFKRE
jgi:hypothetical protein